MSVLNMSSIKLSSAVLALLLVLIGAPYGCSCIKLLDVNIPPHVVQGQDTKLVCNYDLEGDNLYSVKWYRNGHEFYRYMPTDEPSTKIFRQRGIDVDDHRSTETTIHLRNVNLDTTGQYRCEVSGDAPLFQTDAKDAILTVVEYRTVIDPDIISDVTNLTRQEGAVATFDCRVRSSLRPQIKWLKKLDPDQAVNASEVIPVGEDKYKIIHNSRDVPVMEEGEFMNQLVIKEVEKRHAGTYICFVTVQEGGLTYKPFFLNVVPNKNEERSECQEKRPNSMNHYAPVGSIIAWVSKPTANGEAVQIPEGWQRCDGSEIHPPSIWAGEYTPDLNHGKRFLRGGPDVDMLTMEEDQMEDHMHSFNDPGHAHAYTDKYSGCPNEYGKSGPGHIDQLDWSFACPHERTSTSSSSGITVGAVTSSYRRGAETRPKNMNVIYIMRVW